VNKRGQTSEEPRQSTTTLRRREFLESRRAEPVSPKPAQAKIEEPAKRPRERRPQPARWALLREEARSADQAAEKLLSQATEGRAAQLKVEASVARRERAAERISEEQAIHAEALLQREIDQQRLRAGGESEKQRMERQQEAEARRQREEELHAAILRKKAQRQQATATRSDAEAFILQRKAEQRAKETLRPTEMEPVLREPLTPEAEPARVELESPVSKEKRSTRSAVERKQRAAEREIAEAAPTMRRDERRDLKRQAAVQAQMESQVSAERVVPAQRRQPIPAERQPKPPEEERRKPTMRLSVSPRTISGGSTTRTISAAPAASAVGPAASADTTPLVYTRGNFIIDQNGDALTLRGVTVLGMDSVAPQGGQTVTDALSLNATNLATITDQWGANLVRLPFEAATILNGNGNLGASDLQAGLDLTIAAITDAGAYVLLALEAAAGAGPADADTIQVWESLAARYQDEPRVFYEVFASSSPIAGDFTSAFATVIATIRQLDPSSLIFVPGSANGLDVTGVPLRDAGGDPVTNLVYTMSVSVQNAPDPDVLSAVSSVYPVFVSAWSNDGSDLGRQTSRIADLFERCAIGWAAANWNSDPRLVIDAGGGDFTPTIWGNVVLRAIKLTTAPLLEAADVPASLAVAQAEGPALSRLSTSGNFILDESGQTIVLRGVTVVGLDTAAPASGQTLADALSIDENNLALMTGIWGLNLVRLPFQAQTVLTGNGAVPAGKILAGLDSAVTTISEAGAYVLLALEATPGETLPDASTQQAWQTLAKRYKDEPGILYEIYASTRALAPGWIQTALSLIGTIRSQNSAAMIFVNTGNNADFTGFPLLLPTGDPMFNLVYTVNISPQNSPGPDDGPLASFADSYPMFASTWSDDATNPSRVSPYVGDFFARHSIGFAAANWNADPRLVTDAIALDFTSTSWGLIAGRAATLPVRQMLERFRK
jgi:hypothetical protein